MAAGALALLCWLLLRGWFGDARRCATNVRGVFACGDFVTGPTTLIESAGHGKRAAYAIDRYLSGRSSVRIDCASSGSP